MGRQTCDATIEPSKFTKKLIERGFRRETGSPRYICGCYDCRYIFKYVSHYFKRPEHSTEVQLKHRIDLKKVVPDYGAYNLMDPTLYESVKKDDMDAFRNTLQRISREKDILDQFILDRTSPSGNSLLHEAASFGSKKIAKDIIDHHPSLLTRRNIIGDTALHVAAKRGKLDILEVLTVNSGKQTSGNPLEGPSLAYEYNDDMQLLRMQNQVGNTALHEAVIADGLAEVEYLLSKNSETAYYLNKEGVSPFCLAAETGNKDILRRLLELVDGNDKLIGRPRRESPIYAVILQRSLDMLEEIAKTKQVLFHIRDEKGKTPLYFAASKGYLEGVQFLLHYSRQSTLERSTKGDFPIHAACKNGHVNVVNVLLEEQWPDPTELLNKEGQNILHVAAKSGKDVVVKNILRNPKLEKLLNAKDNDGNTAVHLASMNLHPKVVVSLTWDKRIDLKLTNMAGLTALDVLADCGSIPPTTLTERYTVWALFSANTPLTPIGTRILRRRRIPPNQNRIKDMVNLLSLVTILVATVTFAAGLTVPGGINSSESSDHKKDQGMATLVHRGMFQVFIVCDSIVMSKLQLITRRKILSQPKKTSSSKALSLVLIRCDTVIAAFVRCAMTGIRVQKITIQQQR
ncbi:hypothetical protein CMV_005327 [Castanea mollissima]|uniref:PGG domain-containing protein n=1 Tax=Castanea mollissima TaxID=60419 RepID=A0A8J4RR93_9ROSI|nr:hypothetical protein CMV_005327 [Castanea mollissima]